MRELIGLYVVFGMLTTVLHTYRVRGFLDAIFIFIAWPYFYLKLALEKDE